MKKAIFILAWWVCLAPAREYTITFPNQKFQPHYEVSEQLKAGYLPALLEEFSKDSAYTFKMNSLPIKRQMKRLFEGKTDFVIPMNPQWLPEASKGRKVYFSRPLMASEVAFLVKKGSKTNSIKDLKKVGTIRGYTVTPLLKEIKGKEVKIFYSNDIPSLLKLGGSSRVDAIFFHTTLASVRKNKEGLVVSKNLPKVVYSYHLSTLKHPEIIKAFDAWLRENDKKKDRMQKQYEVLNFK